VAKVNMAFQGLEFSERSGFLGQNNPYGKMEELARAKQ
jgi:hypothetical protein